MTNPSLLSSLRWRITNQLWCGALQYQLLCWSVWTIIWILVCISYSKILHQICNIFSLSQWSSFYLYLIRNQDTINFHQALYLARFSLFLSPLDCAWWLTSPPTPSQTLSVNCQSSVYSDNKSLCHIQILLKKFITSSVLFTNMFVWMNWIVFDRLAAIWISYQNWTARKTVHMKYKT